MNQVWTILQDKSGSQKRKIQAVREAKETAGQQSITKFFKKYIQNVEIDVAMAKSNPNYTTSTSLDMKNSQQIEDPEDTDFQPKFKF